MEIQTRIFDAVERQRQEALGLRQQLVRTPSLEVD